MSACAQNATLSSTKEQCLHPSNPQFTPKAPIPAVGLYSSVNAADDPAYLRNNSRASQHQPGQRGPVSTWKSLYGVEQLAFFHARDSPTPRNFVPASKLSKLLSCPTVESS
ncbi:unnamed protein product [Ectocarpus sp. 12 AP-2014]